VVNEVTTGEQAHTSRDHDRPGGREGLKKREAEILALITQGNSNAEIATRVHLSENTVKSYVHQLYRTIGVTSRTQAVLWGARHGFLPPPDRTDHGGGDP
jgi:DNA-binding NarL/FixJ family response regulator